MITFKRLYHTIFPSENQYPLTDPVQPPETPYKTPKQTCHDKLLTVLFMLVWLLADDGLVDCPAHVYKGHADHCHYYGVGHLVEGRTLEVEGCVLVLAFEGVYE